VPERELAAGDRQLTAGDVASLGQALLAVLEGGEHEEIRALVEARLPHANAVHDPIAKRQLGH
jgi:hypothetical protein